LQRKFIYIKKKSFSVLIHSPDAKVYGQMLIWASGFILMEIKK